MFLEIHAVVKGKVQRVGYRDHIERYAREHDLYGWVRNNEDGSVEVVFQGTTDELKGSIEALNVGSPLAKVESLAIDWRTPAKHFVEFKVINQ